MKELDDDWRNIEGFPHYKINKHRQVKRIDAVIIDKQGIPFNRKGRILRSRKTPSGYIQIGLCEKGVRKCTLVHILLAKAFIPNPNNFSDVNHIDGNPQNNDLSNLEWCKHSYDTNHKKQMRKVIRINTETNEETLYNSIRQAAVDNGVYHGQIRASISRNGTCKGYKWKYV